MIRFYSTIIHMLGMQRMNHKRKLSKHERRLDQEARNFELILLSDKTIFPPSSPTPAVPDDRTPQRTNKCQKNKRLNHSPVIIPGTPDKPTNQVPTIPTVTPTIGHHPYQNVFSSMTLNSQQRHITPHANKRLLPKRT
jgi:hypothetical protein